MHPVYRRSYTCELLFTRPQPKISAESTSPDCISHLCIRRHSRDDIQTVDGCMQMLPSDSCTAILRRRVNTGKLLTSCVYVRRCIGSRRLIRVVATSSCMRPHSPLSVEVTASCMPWMTAADHVADGAPRHGTVP